LYNILEVSSENPGKLISDYNKSDHPLMDALDKSVQLATAFEKLEKIPGFSKLAEKLNKKSKSILENEDEKANAGLNTIDMEG
jgi:2-oxo-4-hydroxy-4-carboxy--5-ureidoimidazoline (OHCU) decarboxylase